MPVRPTYPGVYVEEIPSGVRAITGVATSITAFIGRAPKGPVNEPVLINNYGEYEQIFGGLWTESNLGFAVRDFYNNGGSQAAIVRLYNASDGAITKTQLFVPISDATVTGGTVSGDTATVSGGTATLTRSIVTGSSATTESNIGTATITGGTAEVVSSNTVTATVNIGRVEVLNSQTATVTIESSEITVTDSTITVSGGTVSGNTITIEESKVTGDTATVTGGMATVTGGMARVTGGTATVTGDDNTATVSNGDVNQGDNLNGIIVSCGKVTGGTAAVIGGSVTGTTVTVTASKVTGNTATVTSNSDVWMSVRGTVSTVEGDATADVSPGNIVTIETTSTVTGGTVTGVEIDGNQTATVTGGTATISGDTVTVTGSVLTLPMHMLLEAANEGAWGNELQAEVNHDFPTDKGTQAQVAEENLFNLSVKDNNTGVEEIFQNVSANSDHKRYVKNVLEKDSRLVRVSGDVPNGEEPDSDWDYLKSLVIPAVDGKTLEVKDFTGGESEKKGIYALENADLFNLLCIPPYKDDGNVDGEVINAAIIYCEKRRAMMIIDSPSEWANKKDAIGGIDAGVGDTSTNAAIFFPRLVMPNPLKDNQIETFAACGAVAGIFARTDATRGIWKAPAGLEAVLRGGVLGLSVPLTDPENGELNPLGINCLRNKPPAGKIVWGSRTRVGDDRLASEWKYIPVRRLALYMQESLYRGTKWAVFEPNDEPLWAQLRLNIGSFMNNLFRQGAFQGSSASDAYFVKCDKETTTQYDIDRGIVHIVIGFAPLKPAEFVILKFQQIAGQS